jgi:DNA-binding IclR family transcriptional regulator
VSLYASGVGKVILAYQPEPTLSDLIAGIQLQRHTPQTLATEAALRRELEAIRGRGYGYDHGEFEDAIICIAAPIRMADGSVTSGISVSVPKALVPMTELELLLPDLMAAADGVSRANGWDDSSAGVRQHVEVEAGT